MSITPELLAKRVEILEKQITALMAHNTTNPDNNSNNDKKKHKKSTKSDSDDEAATKKKRVSGYILFGKAHRDNVKAELEAANPDTKVKSTEVMMRLGQLWKDLPDTTRQHWNDKAKTNYPPKLFKHHTHPHHFGCGEVAPPATLL